MEKTMGDLNDDMTVIQKYFAQKRRDDHKKRLEWNRTFPPNVEVNVVEDAGMTTTHGVWKTHDGVFIIAKSKNGYHPENRISIPTEIVEAIRSIQ